MCYVYLLRDKQCRIYIGYTTNVQQRLSGHVRGKVYWTRRLSGVIMIYYEAYSDKGLAEDREKQLKIRGSAYQALLKRIGQR